MPDYRGSPGGEGDNVELVRTYPRSTVDRWQLSNESLFVLEFGDPLLSQFNLPQAYFSEHG